MRTLTVTTERLATHLRTVGAPGGEPADRPRELMDLLLGFLGHASGGSSVV
jgi:hypothetical protein